MSKVEAGIHLTSFGGGGGGGANTTMFNLFTFAGPPCIRKLTKKNAT